MHKPALPLEGTDTYNDRIRIVLVETSHSGNIGAVARAMKNMGLGNLWLVNPRSFPDEASYARSSGASDVLDRARVVTTLDEAIDDCVLVMGTSARGRKVPWAGSWRRRKRRRQLPGSQRMARWPWYLAVRATA